jgi:hypothetical protein
MRIINERSVEGCKVTFFAWNNRYLIKLEEGLLEQTFKINQFDVQNEDELLLLADSEFIREAIARFAEMAQSLYHAKGRMLK